MQKSFYKCYCRTACLLSLAGLLVSSPGCERASAEVGGDDPSVSGHTARQAEQVPDYLIDPTPNPRKVIFDALENGKLKNTGDDLAFLQKMLELTGVSSHSQVLVYSLTSHQDAIIRRNNPRAIYFNDEVYIGYVPGGVIEYSDVDPVHGTGFYVLDQTETQHPLTLHETQSCLLCHEGGRTNYNRGLMVRSVFVRENGFPYTSSGSFLVSHDTPMKDRWGGWYVTGEHGAIRHMGNVIASEPVDGGRARVDREAGANITDLSPYFDPTRYLATGSDIVALMVLEHQVEMHNLLTQGGIVINEQLARSRSIAEQLGEPFDPAASNTLQQVLRSKAQKILQHMLYLDEVVLENPVRGDEAFTREFRANRREDAAGRSLKDFDLDTRMFRHRCSYMIYTQAFELMPELLKAAVLDRLAHGLKPETKDSLFEHLDAAEREAIHTILRETHAGYAAHIGEPIEQAD
ncbi:MAG: hypothetical protein AAGC44_11715 [Planctomycetota bacterium]